MNHLTPEELGAHLDHALDGAARERVERHLAECARCREALAELAAQDAALRPALEHDPGDAYFETFAARVEDRIRAAGLKGAQSRLGGDGWLGWLRSPRRLAWAGAAAAVIAGAGIVMLTSRPERSLFQRPELSDRLDQREARSEAVAPPSVQDAGPRDAAVLEAAPPQGFATGPAVPRENEAALRQKSAERAREAPSAKEGKLDGVSLDRVGAEGQDAGAPAPAPAAAVPKRAQAVQRTPHGEDAPIQARGGRTDETRFAEPPPASGEADLKQAKPQMAQPMQTQEEAARSGLAPLGKTEDRDAGTRLCGRVVDERGRPVARATVALADQGRTATADAEGRFCLQAAAGLHELTAMAVGFAPGRMQVRVEGETTDALVTLRAISVLEGGVKALGDRAGRALYRTETPANPFAAVPESIQTLAREADRLATEAGKKKSANAYDAAAVAWERVVAAGPGGPAMLEARYRLAETRFRAWEQGKKDPEAARAKRAVEAYLAVNSYLMAAPAGNRKDRALEWRRQLGF